MAGAELFCRWKPNKPLSFEGTRKASFRYQAEKIKAGEDKHACCLQQAASYQREPHVLHCKADAIHLRGYHKPNKYCRRAFPWSLTATKARGLHLKQRRARSLCSWHMAFCPRRLIMSQMNTAHVLIKSPKAQKPLTYVWENNKKRILFKVFSGKWHIRLSLQITKVSGREWAMKSHSLLCLGEGGALIPEQRESRGGFHSRNRELSEGRGAHKHRASTLLCSKYSSRCFMHILVSDFYHNPVNLDLPALQMGEHIFSSWPYSKWWNWCINAFLQQIQDFTLKLPCNEFYQLGNWNLS